MSELRELIIQMGRELSDQDSAANDLWSWLPSHKEAERHHGDYAFSHQPPLADVLKEAAMFIAHNLAPTPEQVKEAGEWYRCPCGEDHEGDVT